MASTPPQTPAAGPPRAAWAGQLGFVLARLAVPAWVATGATFKLVERNPLLLPKPLFDLVRAGDGTLGMAGLEWLDFALRSFVAIEFVLVAIMVFMPGLARRAALLILGIFIATLLALIVPLWASEGFGKVLQGSCGCFGESGPNPVLMLGADAVLFVLVLLFPPPQPITSATAPHSVGLARGASLAALVGLALAITSFLVPARGTILVDPPVMPAPAPGEDETAPSPPAVPTATQAAPWPAMPSTMQAFYMPEFADWVGTRLGSQPEAALIMPAPPVDIQHGVWNIVFYREDCDHCHELLGSYFSPAVRHPTLCIAIPDTEPDAALEMPCEECQLRSLAKGPQYVLSTPVLLRLEDGIVTRLCGDPEDPSEVEACIE